MRRTISLLFLLACACGEEGPEPGEELSGGNTTVHDTTRNAFTLAARNLQGERRDAFFVGNAIFNRNWVTAPSSTEGLDGLGPTFNAPSCAGCHFKDGRGKPPLEPDEKPLSLLFRLSIPGQDAHGGPLGDPTYGGQLQPQSILGVPAEGHVAITYTTREGHYADGTAYTLEEPHYALVDLAFGPTHPELMVSPRVAPAMVGLGLLEAIPQAALEKLADPNDTNGDGISGRLNHVWDVEHGEVRVGRFGWKSNQPSLRQQNAGAFRGDIGITSDLFPEEECTAAQDACRAAPSGGSPELDAQKLEQVTFYSRTLAVPARRDVDQPEVLKGRRLFREVDCAKCHVPRHETGTLEEMPELSGQVIFPYTDLLLHDMGPDLADNRPDFEATGSEWRTPPLWGIGLVHTVNQHSRFLHDGRARSLEEAILWHGGEAERSREHFRNLSATDRAALLRFLESL
ncbi:di-heme oxidoredictase family protein [Vitiosangium sp. GDMCC 1.1324]|uniref:di-heme oxidoreductase family protein n=1 Tax=Vitiosangium sp. (strain GDMCC 1.1324) TaxID=2138576 RepID=UPI000D3B6EDA|nr:di-heme oxidoredictase family protein [Vitiosangium sp. GDMCC 1.1324]PTL84016.1 thiol oxidoreductase [Vitiosangium sp. GDMCC 1.1324]